MTDDQFKLLMKLMRGNRESPATKAAYLVLVEGRKQIEAAKMTAASPANVHDAVTRYTQVHQQILDAYGLKEMTAPCGYLPRGVDSSGEDRTPASLNPRKNVMNIELKVDWHPSGNRTLKERGEGKGMWKDCMSPSGLLANSDPLDFYKRVQQYIDTLLDQNVAIDFNDTSTKPASSMGIEIKTTKLILTLQNLNFEKLSQYPEPLVVDTISQLLQANYPNIYTETVSWLAYREQIQIAHARKYYPGKTQAQIALRWGELALGGRLKASFNLPYGLSLEE